MKKILVSSLLIVCSLYLEAQTTINFSLKNVLTKQQVSSSDFSSSAGIVLIFSSVACPFDSYYINRIKKLQSSFADKVPLLLVNSYTEAPESEEWMIKTAQANGFTLPYLSDKEQLLMTQLGAQRSPEAFLLKAIDGKFLVVYRGAIDDNAQAENGVKQSYLKEAIENLLSGKAVGTPSSRPAGCYIRKK